MPYLSAKETRKIAYEILSQSKEGLCATELCLSLFEYCGKKLSPKNDFKNPQVKMKLAEWLSDTYPIEWIITCQAVDELMTDCKIKFNKKGVLVLIEKDN